MAKKEITKSKIEREYIIPLREKCRPVPRYKKTPKAVKTIKEFLVRHMKIYDRDLKKIKIDRYLNEFLWFRGIKKPPMKVKVKVIKQGGIVKVELAEMLDKLKFKKLREEKRERAGAEAVEKKKESKKSIMEKAKDTMQKPKEKDETSEDNKNKESDTSVPDSSKKDSSKDSPNGSEKEQKKKQESEKIKSVVEAGNKIGKAAAKKTKHQTIGKTKQPKRPIRQVMNK